MSEKKQKPEKAPAGETKSIRLTPQMIMENAQNDQARLELVTRQIRDLQAIVVEVNNAKNALLELQKSPKGETVLVPLGAGVYVETQSTGNTEVKTMLSGTVMVNRSIADTIQKLDENIASVQKDIETLQKDHQALANNLTQWQALLGQMQKNRAGQNPNPPANQH